MPFLIHIEYTSATKNNLQRTALECYKSFEGFTCKDKHSFVKLINLVNGRFAAEFPKSTPLELKPQPFGHLRTVDHHLYFTVKAADRTQSIIVFSLLPVKGQIELAEIPGFPGDGENNLAE